jgi:deoxycytidylate deaminase
MKTAESIARRSTCLRTNSAGELMQVGCVIATPDFRKILAWGYNGNAAGLPNECDSTTPGACGCIHAEANAVVNCDSPRATEKLVFCTHLPCVNCFVSGTLVSSPSRIQRAYRRWYEGSVFRVVTRHGEITVTPNHPVLALGRGFSAVQSLRQGDYLLYSMGSEGLGPRGTNHKDGQPIQEVFESLARSSLPVRSAGASHQFHGDGLADTDVDVVTVDSALEDNGQSTLLHLLEQPSLPSTNTGGMELILPGSRKSTRLIPMGVGNDLCSGLQQAQLDDAAVHLMKDGEAVDRGSMFVRSDDLLRREWMTACSQVSSATLSSLAQHPTFAETIRNRSLRYTASLSEFISTPSSEIAADEIISILEYRWSGHVYNLQTAGGWYYAGTSHIIAQNCAKLLINLGNVLQVTYKHDYRIRTALELFDTVGIKHRQA